MLILFVKFVVFDIPFLVKISFDKEGRICHKTTVRRAKFSTIPAI